jgi:hypothetical protein
MEVVGGGDVGGGAELGDGIVGEGTEGTWMVGDGLLSSSFHFFTCACTLDNSSEKKGHKRDNSVKRRNDSEF